MITQHIVITFFMGSSYMYTTPLKSFFIPFPYTPSPLSPSLGSLLQNICLPIPIIRHLFCSLCFGFRETTLYLNLVCLILFT